MQGTYLKNKCDLGGFVVGEVKVKLPKKERMFDGCFIYGIPSSGIHSNGYTLVRKLLKKSIVASEIDTILEPTPYIYKCTKIMGILSR